MGIEFRVDARSTMETFGLLQRDVERAAKQGLRKAARVVVKQAKSGAPVYAGGDPTVPRGMLRKSVHQSKEFRRIPGGFNLLVTPFGPQRTRFYAGFQEAEHGYMAAGRAAGEASAEQIFIDTFDAAIQRTLAKRQGI